MMRDDRKEVLERLANVQLGRGSHENLSAICDAVYHSDYGWTNGACAALKASLERLLSEPEPVSGPISGEVEQVSETCETGPEIGSGGRMGVTTELRERGTGTYGNVVYDEREFSELCDAIDSIHASLERENEALRESSSQHAELSKALKSISDMSGPYRNLADCYDAVKASRDRWKREARRLRRELDEIGSPEAQAQADSFERIADDLTRAYNGWKEGVMSDASYREEVASANARMQELAGSA